MLFCSEWISSSIALILYFWETSFIPFILRWKVLGIEDSIFIVLGQVLGMFGCSIAAERAGCRNEIGFGHGFERMHVEEIGMGLVGVGLVVGTLVLW